MKPLMFFGLVLILTCLSGEVLAAPAQHRVTSIPGFGNLPFPTYAGYFSPEDGDKQLFYIFVQSQGNPSTDPVVLWLNGGPGCSSFDGFIYEHGPFNFNPGPDGPNQNLTLNPYSWNKIANVLYLDSPAGVGLSFSNNSDDYNTGDKITALNTYHFLVNWFRAFPEFKGNEFFISGESYAGVYVPTLAQQILHGNRIFPNYYINLKGILVGNGVTSDIFDGDAWIPFVYGHGLIDIDLYNKTYIACNGSYWNPQPDSECESLLYQIADLVGDLNIYGIYDDCYYDSLKNSRVPLHNPFYRISQRVRDSLVEKKVVAEAKQRGDVPCIDSSRAEAWLNQDSIRTALHAISVKDQEWTICTDQINYDSDYDTLIPIHLELLEYEIRILIYSGDVDLCVPYTGSEAWTRSLGFPTKQDWRPWKVNRQVAGYVIEYDGGLTFATIKGSGHTVPQFKPSQSLHFFRQFLEDQPL